MTGRSCGASCYYITKEGRAASVEAEPEGRTWAWVVPLCESGWVGLAMSGLAKAAGMSGVAFRSRRALVRMPSSLKVMLKTIGKVSRSEPPSTAQMALKPTAMLGGGRFEIGFHRGCEHTCCEQRATMDGWLTWPADIYVAPVIASNLGRVTGRSNPCRSRCQKGKAKRRWHSQASMALSALSARLKSGQETSMRAMRNSPGLSSLHLCEMNGITYIHTTTTTTRTRARTRTVLYL